MSASRDFPTEPVHNSPGDPRVLVQSPISATLLAIAVFALVAPFVMKGLGKFKKDDD